MKLKCLACGSEDMTAEKDGLFVKCGGCGKLMFIAECIRSQANLKCDLSKIKYDLETGSIIVEK